MTKGIVDVGNKVKHRNQKTRHFILLLCLTTHILPSHLPCVIHESWTWKDTLHPETIGFECLYTPVGGRTA